MTATALRTDRLAFAPHADIELGLPRQEVEAFVCSPSEMSEEHPLPLVITIPGYGQTADDEYFREKLNPYIAERYGCLVMSVNYHGIKKTPGPFDFRQLGALIEELHVCYGWRPTSSNQQDAVGEFVLWAGARNIQRLPISVKRFLRFLYPEYLSFGFLPAMDHFMAIAELARKYRFDRRRIVLFGSSYGGYIANLMSKFAPNSFSLVIDNSGFARVLLRDVLAEELLDGEQKREISYGAGKVTFPFTPSYPWTLNELAPSYFSDARRCIRSLLHPGHWAPSASRHCIFHSVADDLVPVAEKDRVVEILREKGRTVDYHRVEPSDIDGKIFKTAAHGMDASLRSLFEIAVPDLIPELETMTDYELESSANFLCGNETYQFRYTPEYGFKAELHSNPNMLDLSHRLTR